MGIVCSSSQQLVGRSWLTPCRTCSRCLLWRSHNKHLLDLCLFSWRLEGRVGGGMLGDGWWQSLKVAVALRMQHWFKKFPLGGEGSISGFCWLLSSCCCSKTWSVQTRMWVGRLRYFQWCIWKTLVSLGRIQLPLSFSTTHCFSVDKVCKMYHYSDIKPLLCGHYWTLYRHIYKHFKYILKML